MNFRKVEGKHTTLNTFDPEENAFSRRNIALIGEATLSPLEYWEAASGYNMYNVGILPGKH